MKKKNLKELNAYKVTLFVLGVLTILGAAVYFTPEEGLDLGFTKVKFLSQDDFYNPKKQEKADISELIAAIDTTILRVEEVKDIVHTNESDGSLGAPKGGALTEDASTELQLNDRGIASMQQFFQTLRNVSTNKEQISILHYGDSQIEGDRMTSFIRQRIQNQFGGNGPGLIPAKDTYNSFTFRQSCSDNITRYTAFGGKKLTERHYGAMASVARFTPEYVLDSLFTIDSLAPTTAWIEFEPSAVAYPRAKSYNNVTLHYNQCVAPTKVVISQNGATIHEEELKPDSAYHDLKLSFPDTPGKLRYTFTGKISPNICAFSLDGDYGVQVSNIAMRGSSGTVFSRLKSNTLQPMYTALNTKMAIMQFGGNSIPFFKDSTGVRNFARYFKSQINTLKRLNPDIFIVVVGPSDMSSLENGIYSTYTFLPYCVEQMKEATIASGSAYWNMYAAMGGNNSMPSWVEKGLAGNDYIHFSSKGAKIASQLFYDAFIAEYAKWNKTN
ncbi:MAG: hypothetical protein P8H33_01525 [Crocinitomicaceae bacterium]|nr:hypothetical protein [Crocinitomicaceae bacterium]